MKLEDAQQIMANILCSDSAILNRVDVRFYEQFQNYWNKLSIESRNNLLQNLVDMEIDNNEIL